MSDESIAILNLCNNNLQRILRSVVFGHFEEKLQRMIDQNRACEYSSRDKTAVKVQKAMQRELQATVKNKELFEKEINMFESNVCKECTYLKELLEQITKLQILLMSKIRKKAIESIEIDVPDLRCFCTDIVKNNSISIFKNVDLFYRCCRKNKSEFNHIIDANTETCLNDLTTKAMSSFFSGGNVNAIEKSAVERAIERSKLDGEKPDDENREIPKLRDNKDEEFEYKPEYKVIDLPCTTHPDEKAPPAYDAPPVNDLPSDPTDVDVKEDTIEALPSFEKKEEDPDGDELLSQW